MKIQRTVKGKVLEFELTQEEMAQAVSEFAQQSYYDFMMEQIEDMSEHDPHAALMKLDTQARINAVQSMLQPFQHLIEDVGYDEFEAWDQVAHDYVAQHNL